MTKDQTKDNKQESTLDQELQPIQHQPVIIKQFDVDEALNNPLIQNLIGAGINYLNTESETNKIVELTEQERVKSQIELAKLKNEDNADERKFKFRQNIVKKVHTLLLFLIFCGLILILYRLEIMNKEVAQLLIIIFTVLFASGTDVGSIISKQKSNKQKDD